jgi:hypothetical protein
MRSRGGMLVAAKMDKVNSANIQTMIDKHADANALYFDICSLSYNLFALMRQILPLEFVAIER